MFPNPLIVAAIACLLCSGSAKAADALHWYEVVIAKGNSTETFVGTCAVDMDRKIPPLSGEAVFTLENLRVHGTKDQQTLWWPVREGQKLILRQETIVYFYVLPGDPAGKP